MSNIPQTKSAMAGMQKLVNIISESLVTHKVGRKLSAQELMDITPAIVNAIENRDPSLINVAIERLNVHPSKTTP